MVRLHAGGIAPIARKLALALALLALLELTLTGHVFQAILAAVRFLLN